MTDGPSYVCSDMPARLHQPHSFSAAQLVSFPLLAKRNFEQRAPSVLHGPKLFSPVQ